MDDKLFLLSQISLLEELPKEELLQVERMTLAKPIKKERSFLPHLLLFLPYFC
ncbi:hypothetical protein [Bacillus coahuilensis]|uniref:hypothetical protein n=1 Tax=Bacillus coahuilensis TaxID=408580 RepID=UPI000AF39031